MVGPWSNHGACDYWIVFPGILLCPVVYYWLATAIYMLGSGKQTFLFSKSLASCSNIFSTVFRLSPLKVLLQLYHFSFLKNDSFSWQILAPAWNWSCPRRRQTFRSPIGLSLVSPLCITFTIAPSGIPYRCTMQTLSCLRVSITASDYMCSFRCGGVYVEIRTCFFPCWISVKLSLVPPGFLSVYSPYRHCFHWTKQRGPRTDVLVHTLSSFWWKERP